MDNDDRMSVQCLKFLVCQGCTMQYTLLLAVYRYNTSLVLVERGYNPFWNEIFPDLACNLFPLNAMEYYFRAARFERPAGKLRRQLWQSWRDYCGGGGDRETEARRDSFTPVQSSFLLYKTTNSCRIGDIVLNSPTLEGWRLFYSGPPQEAEQFVSSTGAVGSTVFFLSWIAPVNCWQRISATIVPRSLRSWIDMEEICPNQPPPQILKPNSTFEILNNSREASTSSEKQGRLGTWVGSKSVGIIKQ